MFFPNISEIILQKKWNLKNHEVGNNINWEVFWSQTIWLVVAAAAAVVGVAAAEAVVAAAAAVVGAADGVGLHPALNEYGLSREETEFCERFVFGQVGEDPAGKVGHDFVRVQREAFAHHELDDRLQTGTSFSW